MKHCLTPRRREYRETPFYESPLLSEEFPKGNQDNEEESSSRSNARRLSPVKPRPLYRGLK